MNTWNQLEKAEPKNRRIGIAETSFGVIITGVLAAG